MSASQVVITGRMCLTWTYSDSDSVCSVLVNLVAPEALVKLLLSPFGTL